MEGPVPRKAFYGLVLMIVCLIGAYALDDHRQEDAKTKGPVYYLLLVALAQSQCDAHVDDKKYRELYAYALVKARTPEALDAQMRSAAIPEAWALDQKSACGEARAALGPQGSVIGGLLDR
jgi:hypothetical protein